MELLFKYNKTLGKFIQYKKKVKKITHTTSNLKHTSLISNIEFVFISIFSNITVGFFHLLSS